MKILNFGSLNIDHVYKVDHFVSPGETLSTNSLEYFCGGKGLNQSIALAKAGANVYHAGKIGYDGLKLKEALQANGVNIDFLEQTDVANGHALIQVNSLGENSIIVYSGSNKTITEEYVDKVLENFGIGDIVLMQNEINCISYIAQKCAEKNISIVFNPSPMSDELLEEFPFNLVTLLLINEVEGHAITGKTTTNEILACIMEKYPNISVVLTQGSLGAVYCDKYRTCTHGTYDVDVIDTTAAGDSFTGFFLSSLANKDDISICLKKASVASSLAVSRKGASSSIPTIYEVNEMESKLNYREYRPLVLT